MKTDSCPVHFFSKNIPPLLQNLMKNFAGGKGSFDILDLGCGDGRIFFSLRSNGLLTGARNIVGVDISESRINRLKQRIPGVKGIVSDACSVKDLDAQSMDVIICSQVIEHVPDDTLLLKEVIRLLKPGGCAYISSIVKKKYGYWIYRRDGTFRVDPTHIREYASKEEFTRLLESSRLAVAETALVPVKYSILELLLRLLMSLGIIGEENIPDNLLRNSLFNLLRKISVPVIGYATVEAICKLKTGM